MLLTIDTDLCSITIEGPDRSSRWRSSNPGSTPTLRVRADGGAIRCLTWPEAADLAVGEREYRGDGPALAEETNYQLTVASAEGSGFNCSTATLFSSPTSAPCVATNVLAGSINFRSQVGRSLFAVTDGTRSVEFEVEVRPTKLDYDLDYQDLIDGVSGLSRQLVLEYLRATYREGRAEIARSNTPLEWLLLLREEVDHLERALEHVAAQPYVQLVRERRCWHLSASSARVPACAGHFSAVRGRGRGLVHLSVLDTVVGCLPTCRRRRSIPPSTVGWPLNCEVR